MEAPQLYPTTGGLGVLFDVADVESASRPFAGLALLSHVCVEEGGKNARRMSSGALLPPSKRVGLRPPQNEHRDTVLLLPSPLPKASGWSCRSVYLYYCREFGMKPNSTVCASLSDVEDDFASITAVTVSNNFLGERGILPLLEVVRLCLAAKNSALSSLAFPDCGLKNPAVEWLVEAVLAAPTDRSLPLRSIDLSGNRISLGAGKVLLDLVSARTQLVDVNVNETCVDPPLRLRLRLQLEANVAAAAAAAAPAPAPAPVPSPVVATSSVSLRSLLAA